MPRLSSLIALGAIAILIAAHPASATGSRHIKAAQMPAVTVTPPLPPNYDPVTMGILPAPAATAAPTPSLANSADTQLTMTRAMKPGREME
jgi:hypothetical protein